MRNIKLTIQYDGTDFFGWQRQRAERSVQQVIEDALSQITGEKTTLYGAGRTDAGVHAEGQVANFHTNSRHPPEVFLSALNATVERDVAVVHAEEVQESFHARKHAKRKIYRYVVWHAPVRPVIGRQYVYHLPAVLDLAAMRGGATFLVGENDFRSFACKTPSPKNCVRHMYEISIAREGPRIVFTLQGSGFLYMMARSIVGTLLHVGLGKLAALDLKRILHARDRRQAGPTAPAAGLSLVQVIY